ncbi:hypothetical protein PHMEG_00028803 [Phytophthora megakarya]|uniref:PiggyBac transposable element-derived protein domain-containing protein n=1 Tax=Phytophthora megakarya TaxID=4795 RepID=A0A225V590_9STRA|nr:hypothetical protein PHMEG_00028803 [Phytophthora megakarya]
MIKDGGWFSWLSIRLAIFVETRSGPLRIYWDTESREGFIDTAANVGQRFGMDRHYFGEIMACMAFSDGNNGDDPWKPTRPIVVDDFNARRLRVLLPGNILCVAECMRAWKMREPKYCHYSLPHMTMIARKPEVKGTELKSFADGESGVLLGIELVEEACRQRTNQYAREYGEGTAVILRLAEPYRGTGRTIVDDSAFASVKRLFN